MRPMNPAEIDQALRELLPPLRRFARALARDPATADDLVQSTLERALGAWNSRRDDDALRPWLFAILHRQFLDHRRRAKRYAWLLARAAPGEDSEPSAERTAIARSALDAFKRLPAAQRTLLLLTSVEGLSYREVSEVLDIPIGTVMSRLSRARQALRSLGEGDTPAPPLRLLK